MGQTLSYDFLLASFSAARAEFCGRRFRIVRIWKWNKGVFLYEGTYVSESTKWVFGLYVWKGVFIDDTFGLKS